MGDRTWKLFNGYGPLADGLMRVERIGPDGGGGITTDESSDMAGTREDLEGLISAVNSHQAAVRLCNAVLQSDKTRSKWLPKIICLAEEFKALAKVLP